MVGEGEAQTLKKALESGHADLLKDVGLKVDPMRVGAEGLLVRLRSGAVGDRGAAEAVCARFRARQVECQVVKSLSIDVTRRDETDPTRQADSARTPVRRAVPVSVAVKPSVPKAASEAIPVKRERHMLAVDAGEADRWRVQVGAGRSEDEARQRWSALLGSHGDLLEALELFVYRADLGQKGVYYRVQLGRFGKRESAATLCSHLKQRQVDCFVTASPN
jgi:cell division septation protein DedD